MNELHTSSEFEDKVRAAMDVPNANPEFVKKLHHQLVINSSPVKIKPRWTFRPAWAIAFVLALTVFALSLPKISAALGRIFGYVPGVGLVENSGNLRVLQAPVSVTRDDVT